MSNRYENGRYNNWEYDDNNNNNFNVSWSIKYANHERENIG